MFISHVWELAGGKIHYFAAPFALGLLTIRGAKAEESFMTRGDALKE